MLLPPFYTTTDVAGWSASSRIQSSAPLRWIPQVGNHRTDIPEVEDEKETRNRPITSNAFHRMLVMFLIPTMPCLLRDRGRQLADKVP